MRITGGKLKGRVIKCPDGIIRPAMDRMRESVFAILGDLEGKSWLDLFSGSAQFLLRLFLVAQKKFSFAKKTKLKSNKFLKTFLLQKKNSESKSAAILWL